MPNHSYHSRLSVPYTRLWSPTWLHMRPLIAALREASARVTGLVLDVGCGNKPYVSLFGPERVRYIGLDLAPETGTRPDIVGTGDQIPFADATFDVALAIQMLEHVPDPERVVGEINRVLKPGGRVILTAPQSWRVHEVPRDFYRFTRFGLEYLLRLHGLEIIELKALGGSYALAGQVLLNTYFYSLGRWTRLPWLWSRMTVLLVTAPLVVGTNLWFAALDRLFCDTADTIGYLVIAEKVLS